MSIMYQRTALAQIKTALQDTPAVYLAGARQTGKSTLAKILQNEYPDFKYVNLDDLNILNAALLDPLAFIAGNSNQPIIIDEIQRAPELFLPIKQNIDQDRQPGRFLLTGSANALVLPEVVDALTGRMEIIPLWPLAQSELIGNHHNWIDWALSDNSPMSIDKINIEDIIQKVITGGYPECQQRNDKRQQAWFQNYLAALINKDLKTIANIDATTELSRLLHTLAARTAGIFNIADLSRTIDLPQTTLKRYISYFETLFLIQRLPAWSTSFTKKTVKSPKLLFNDSGIICHLLNVDAKYLMQNPTQFGPLFENFMIMECIKQISFSQAKPKYYHFRNTSGHEVDLVLEYPNGKIVAIEIKAKHTLREKDTKGLSVLKDICQKNFHRGFILYLGSETIPFGKDIWAIPASALWHCNE